MENLIVVLIIAVAAGYVIRSFIQKVNLCLMFLTLSWRAPFFKLGFLGKAQGWDAE